MRLFVAVEIGVDVQDAVSGVIAELKRRVAQSAPHARVTWVNAGHLHLTLVFIGTADAVLNDKIQSALERPIAVPAFSLTIAGTGTFPPRRPPRVIWAGVSGGLDAVHSVEREVRARLDRLVSYEAERAYHPHVTLGRVKNPAGLRPTALLEGVKDAAFGVVQVGAVTLFESRLSSAGPMYIPLRRTALARTS
jgi:2'-5' RNA ligase